MKPIEELESRELDAAVAIECFGWKVYSVRGNHGSKTQIMSDDVADVYRQLLGVEIIETESTDFSEYGLSLFSTDPAANERVVEWLQQRPAHPEGYSFLSMRWHEDGWRVGWVVWVRRSRSEYQFRQEVGHPSRLVAVCRFAITISRSMNVTQG
jgi:hypothetical protein